ncbi:MAG: hypothetical protein EOO38_33010, partial [Cytophagaceae bacterium]
MAVIYAHDSLSEQKVPEQGSHHKVLPEELLKQRLVEAIPGDSVGDGGKDPVKLAKWRSPFADFAW